MGFFDFMQEAIAIDLGTANTLIIHNDKVVVDEPSIVAKNVRTGEVIAIGKRAQQMHGKAHKNIETMRPLKDGVIADFQSSEQMIRGFIDMIPRKRSWFAPALKMVVCIPSGVTEVEKRAVVDSAEHAGAKDVWLIHEPMAAAIGAGLPVEEAVGSMVVDVGGGTTEIAILSLSGVVYADSVRIGGDRFDEAIVNFVRREYGSVIGDTTAERIKMEIGGAYLAKEVREIEVRGRNLAEGIPKRFSLTSDEILGALQEPLVGIVQAVKRVLEQSPPELASDIAEAGIVLTGGGALLKDLDKLLAHETGLPVIVAEEPLTCVARGGGEFLDMMDNRKLNKLAF